LSLASTTRPPKLWPKAATTPVAAATAAEVYALVVEAVILALRAAAGPPPAFHDMDRKLAGQEFGQSHVVRPCRQHAADDDQPGSASLVTLPR
jgi:hypothetical protein